MTTAASNISPNSVVRRTATTGSRSIKAVVPARRRSTAGRTWWWMPAARSCSSRAWMSRRLVT